MSLVLFSYMFKKKTFVTFTPEYTDRQTIFTLPMFTAVEMQPTI